MHPTGMHSCFIVVLTLNAKDAVMHLKCVQLFLLFIFSKNHFFFETRIN